MVLNLYKPILDFYKTKRDRSVLIFYQNQIKYAIILISNLSNIIQVNKEYQGKY